MAMGRGPYFYDGGMFIRVGSETQQVDPSMYEKIFLLGNRDALVEKASHVQDLTFQGTISRLRKEGIHASHSMKFYRSFEFLTKNSEFNLLASLLSDQRTSIVSVTRFLGEDKSEMGNRISFSNESLLVTVDKVLKYFNQLSLTKSVGFVDGLRTEKALFNFEVFQEAWINACVHNAWILGIPPSIHIFSNRIEIISNGGLPYSLHEDQFFAGLSQPVNKRLFEIFICCKFCEQSGYGVPLIVRKYGKEAFSISDNCVIVTIPFGPEKACNAENEESAATPYGSALTDTQLLILSCLQTNEHSSLQHVADCCNLKLVTVRKNVAKLQDMGFLKRIGAKNRPTWIILER